MTATTEVYTATRAEHWPVDAEAYHADHSKVSHSMLECFRKNRRRYHGIYIAGKIAKQEPTEAMLLGSLVHLAVLEPEKYTSDTAVAPKVDRRTKDGKATWEQFCSDSAGKRIATAEQFRLVESISEAVYTNPVAARLLCVPGATEHSIYWQDEATGLTLKSRRDRVCDGLVIDLKTCRDASPEGFAKAAATLGYHRQAAHYLDGEMTRTGLDCDFVFIAVETEPPHIVCCYELDQAAIDMGQKQNAENIEQLARCLNTGEWAAPYERQINTIPLPRWTAYSEEWSVSE